MTITDFQIHAYVDRELDSREQSEILCEAARSPRLAGQIADLQQLKHLLRHAYGEAETVEAGGNDTLSTKHAR